jgi:hypothetical protein
VVAVPGFHFATFLPSESRILIRTKHSKGTGMSAHGQKYIIAFLDDEDGWLRFDDQASNLCESLDDAYDKAATAIEVEFKAQAVVCDRTRKAENVLVAGGIEYKVFLASDPSVPAS